jgi:hypothetical protein
MRAVWMTLVAAACGGESSSPDAAMPDALVLNPPISCPANIPVQHPEPIPPLVGTWKLAGFMGGTTVKTLTLSTTENAYVLLGETMNTTTQETHLFTGNWTLEPTVASRCQRNGNATTLSYIYVESGQLKIFGSTRVPGFHTAYETTEYFYGQLVP